MTSTPPEFTAPGVDLNRINSDADEQPLSAAAFGFGEDTSDLDDLDAELGPVKVPTIRLKVPQRPRYLLECRVDFTSEDLQLLRTRAANKRHEGGIDDAKFAALLVALTCVAVHRDGQPLDLDGESPVTFATPAFQRKLGKTQASDTVRAFYALDGDLSAAHLRLMHEAGYGTVAELVDPTQ